GADAVAVVGVAQGEETGAAPLPDVHPVLKGDLQGLLHGGGAVGGEQEVRLVDGNDAGEGLGQLDHGPVAVPQHRRVGHPAQLVDQGGVQLGYPVAEGRDPEGRDGVEVAAAVDVDDLPPLGPLDNH